MDSAQTVHRLHFAFTIVYHYLFPQLTMGLAVILVALKGMALRTGEAHYDRAARFWSGIFAINFVMGVVTGIPMEFQFGTNWSVFSQKAGGVIGQTLAMEGVFSFFLESTFLGLFLYAEHRLGRVKHMLVAVLLAAGTWLSGFFIVATNAWMQHPVGHRVGPDGRMHLESMFDLLTNPWLFWQYPHTMLGSLVTASVVVAAIGAFYLLRGVHQEYGRTFVRTGILIGFPAALTVAFPTGDRQAHNVHSFQPVTFAAMEGHFKTKRAASMILIGQPDMERMTLDNPIEVPAVLSILTHNRWNAEVTGLDAFPRDQWPQNIPLLYYCYHIMVGLGTILIGALGMAGLLLWRGRLFDSQWMLWILMLLLPFPYIANTTGWMAAELGRQPWLVHGLMRTDTGFSPHVSAGNALFTLIGFMGVYSVLSILFGFLVMKRIQAGPEPERE